MRRHYRRMKEKKTTVYPYKIISIVLGWGREGERGNSGAEGGKRGSREGKRGKNIF